LQIGLYATQLVKRMLQKTLMEGISQGIQFSLCELLMMFRLMYDQTDYPQAKSFKIFKFNYSYVSYFVNEWE